MRLSLIIDADGKFAVNSVNKLTKSVSDAGAASDKLSAKSKKAATDTKSLGQSARGADAAIDNLSAAQKRNEQTAKGMGAANRAAAGSMGNLVAQFNDIGVMMAAGQNPLTLALQQGTQISQVIGPMGAAGAVKSLGGAFLGMLNPISLVTIGVIAGGAAFTQWAVRALSAGEEAKSFEDRIEDLTASVDAYKQLAEQSQQSTQELAKEFGASSEEIRTQLGLLERLAQVDALDLLAKNVTALKEDMTPITDVLNRLNILSLQNAEGGTAWRREIATLRDEYGLTADQANALQVAVQAVSQSNGAGELLASSNALSDILGGIYGDLQDWPALFQTIAKSAALSNEQAARLEAVTYNANAAFERQGFLIREGNLARGQATSDARDMLATLVEQNSLQLAIKTHGEDSAEVAALRAASERDVFEEMLATMDVSEQLKDELFGAFLVSQDIANTDLGAGIRSAAADAATLAQNLRLAATFSGEDAAMNVPVIPGATGNQANNRAVDNLRRLTRAPRGRRGGGAGGGRSRQSDATREAKRQREAVETLTERLEDELAILRETDPVQKEILRNREALSAATTDERKTIADMIAQRNAETDAIALQEEKWDTARGAVAGFFDDLRTSGGTLESALSGVIDKLADMVFQASLLGEGPLAGMFGSTANGGVIGSILGAAFPTIAPANLSALPAKARGGDIIGPGTGTSDDVLMWGSNGEYVATAEATSKYRPILEAMNAGTLTSGTAGGRPSEPSSPSGGGVTFAPKISIENTGSTPAQGEMQEETGSGGRNFKLVLADQVGAALGQKGGGARRTLRTGYGIKGRGTRR